MLVEQNKTTVNEGNKNMKAELLIEVANSFKAEIAAQYHLPELREVLFAGEEVVGKANKSNDVFVLKTGDISVAPSGQMAGIVRSMQVSLTVWDNGTSTMGELKYRYQHHGGGSNGNEQRFVIVT